MTMPAEAPPETHCEGCRWRAWAAITRRTPRGHFRHGFRQPVRSLLSGLLVAAQPRRPGSGCLPLRGSPAPAPRRMRPAARCARRGPSASSISVSRTCTSGLPASSPRYQYMLVAVDHGRLGAVAALGRERRVFGDVEPEGLRAVAARSARQKIEVGAVALLPGQVRLSAASCGTVAGGLAPVRRRDTSPTSRARPTCAMQSFRDNRRSLRYPQNATASTRSSPDRTNVRNRHLTNTMLNRSHQTDGREVGPRGVSARAGG